MQNFVRKLKKFSLHRQHVEATHYSKARGGRICKPLEKLEIYWFNFEDIKTWIVVTSCTYIKPIQRDLDMEMKKQVCQMEFLFDDFLDTCIVKRV